MGEEELKNELQRRFDKGAPLRPGLEPMLEEHPACAAYCARLESLAAELEQLPWHEPDPQLACAVKRRIQEEEVPAFQRFGTLMAGMLTCALVSLVAGMYLQPYLPYTELERQVTSLSWQRLLQPEGTLLEPVPLSALEGIPYAEQTVRWLDFEALYQYVVETTEFVADSLSLSGVYLWVGLIAAFAGLMVFNGVLLRSVRAHTLQPVRH